MSKSTRWSLQIDNDLAVFRYGGEVVFTWKEPPGLTEEIIAMIQQAWETGRTYGQLISPDQARRGHEVVCDLQAFLDDLTGDNP